VLVVAVCVLQASGAEAMEVVVAVAVVVAASDCPWQLRYCKFVVCLAHAAIRLLLLLEWLS
jgi:hypothetical protein